MKTYRERNRTAPIILTLGIRQRSVVKCTPRGNNPGPTEQEANWASESVWTFWKGDKSPDRTVIRTPDRPAPSLVTIPSAYDPGQCKYLKSWQWFALSKHFTPSQHISRFVSLPFPPRSSNLTLSSRFSCMRVYKNWNPKWKLIFLTLLWRLSPAFLTHINTMPTQIS
jgi:hypothetical protein